MAAVAEQDRVTVKSERRTLALGIVFEVTFSTVLPCPVGIDYFLLCFTGWRIGCQAAAERYQEEQGYYYPATHEEPGDL
jgi:hypothetical protein